MTYSAMQTNDRMIVVLELKDSETLCHCLTDCKRKRFHLGETVSLIGLIDISHEAIILLLFDFSTIKT